MHEATQLRDDGERLVLGSRGVSSLARAVDEDDVGVRAVAEFASAVTAHADDGDVGDLFLLAAEHLAPGEVEADLERGGHDVGECARDAVEVDLVEHVGDGHASEFVAAHRARREHRLLDVLLAADDRRHRRGDGRA